MTETYSGIDKQIGLLQHFASRYLFPVFLPAAAVRSRSVAVDQKVWSGEGANGRTHNSFAIPVAPS